MNGLIQVLIAAACLALHAQAGAQPYPSKPVRVMVGFAAGAATDLLARIVSAKLSDNLGQQLIVENRAGAGGVLANEVVAKAAPDGYTLVLGESGGMAVAPAMMKSPPYDPRKAFAPIAQLVSVSVLLVAHPSLGAKTLGDLKALAAGKPLPYGSAGTGTIQHLAVELLKNTSGLPLEHVSYKGGAPALQDLLAGVIPLLVITPATILPHVKSGKVVALAVLNSSRSGFLPDLPTARESGFPAYGIEAWQGLFAPAGTPREIVARLNSEVGRALSAPEVVQKLVSTGSEIVTGTPEAFAKQVQDDIERWAKVVRDAGITPN